MKVCGNKRKYDTHTYTCGMGTRNISISDEAYSRLAAQKRSKESFTDVINRLTKKKSILDLSGILTEPESRELRSNIRKLRKSSTKRLDSIARRM